jgi:NADH-quinone oxidoreductase subunit J
MITFFFILFAATALISAVLMISHKNPVYSAVFLIVTFFSIAGMYFLLDAPFLGIIQIIVYAGAIMVLFLFVMMLLNQGRESGLPIGKTRQTVIGLLFSALLFAPLFLILWSGWFALTKDQHPAMSGSVEKLGLLLFSKYLYPFEIASLLLLVGIVGAIILGRKKNTNEN